MRRSLIKKDKEAMSYNYNRKYITLAQNLRKNMTTEEKHLWYDLLKKLPMTVNRQKNIGDYIVDLYIAQKRIVIEIDGSQHEMEEKMVSDKERDKELKKIGITVLRYSNSDINKNFNTVSEDILNHLELKFNDLKQK